MVAALLYAGKGSGLSRGFGVWWFGLIPEQPHTISVSALAVATRCPELTFTTRARAQRRPRHGLGLVALSA